MTDARRARRPATGPAVAVVGAVMSAVAALLPWETVDGNIAAMGRGFSALSGVDTPGGKIVLAGSLIVLIVAALGFWAMSPPASVPSTITVAGAIITGVGFLAYIGTAMDVADGNAIAPNMLGVGVGLYVSVLGGVVVLVGGVLTKAMSKN